MEETNSTLAVITPGCYIAKVDTKDAYYSVAIFARSTIFFLIKFVRLLTYQKVSVCVSEMIICLVLSEFYKV